MSARTEWFYHVLHPLLIPVWTEDHFINLKFNRSLFYDVGRECSLEGKFEAVINRKNPAYLLKLDGKDKTVFSQQVSAEILHGDNRDDFLYMWEGFKKK